VKLTDEQNVALARAFLGAWHGYWEALDYEHPGVHVAEHAAPASEAAVSAVVELLERDFVRPLRDTVIELHGVLVDMVDPDPCQYDHHGYCQAHGWLQTQPPCPHLRAKKLL
jgi:hypothetical protein